MFGTIRKHQTWLWTILIGVMSVSLVALFTSVDFSGSGGGRQSKNQPDLGTINGRPISQSEYADAWREVRLASFLHNGKWPGSDESTSRRIEGETVSRVFILSKLKELNIRASDKAVALIVHEHLNDFPYERLEKEILAPNGLTLADYDRFVRNEAGIRQLISAASVTARLVSPSEAESIWRKENQEFTGQLATFWSKDYLDKVVITNGAISGLYSNRQAFYRVPEQIIVSYVTFASSNFFAEAEARMGKMTNLNEMISDYYFRSKGNTNAWLDTNGVALSEAAAKLKIREEFRSNEALLAARRAAAEFGNLLITQPDPNKAGNLESLAASKGLTVRTTRPFDRTLGLDEFENEQALPTRSEEEAPESFKEVFRERALTLTQERPVLFSPIPSRNAVYLIARKGTVPSELPPLEKIKDKVTADYKKFMSFDLARRAGQAFHTTLTNGLSQGKSFAEIAASANVKVMDLPAFSLNTPGLTNLDERINLRAIQGAAAELDTGKASAYLPAQSQLDGGMIFYVKARPPIDTAKMQAAMPAFMGRLRSYRQGEAFQQWFQKQAEQAKVSTPKKDTTVGTPN